MVVRLLIIFLLLTSFSFGQPSNPQIKRVDKYKKSIDKKFKAKELIPKEYPQRSVYGGALTGYYLDNRLVLITANNNVAEHSTQTTFYIMADTLVFVKEIIKQSKESKNLDPDVEKQRNSGKDIAPSKGALEIDDNNIYYFQSDSIIGLELKSFNRKLKTTKEAVAEKNEIIITQYRSHVDELDRIERTN